MKKTLLRTHVGRIIDSWRKGERPSTRAALEQNPEIRGQSSAVMSLALEEYRIRCRSGEKLAVTQFCDEFSTYRDELRRMLDVENGLADLELIEAPVWPEPGDDFEQFHLHEVLGDGAASRVYLASQTNLGGRRVALKITPFETGEANTLGKLQHRCVVPVLSVHEHNSLGLTSVCMPYLGSATLQDVRALAFARSRSGELPGSARVILEAARRGTLEGEFLRAEPAAHRVLLQGTYIEGIAHVIADLAEGLAYTHGQGILHRDLKPSNVLITPSGRPMLLDFNLAWDAQRESMRLGGTLPYMSPEQLYATFLSNDDCPPPDDPRSDIYSLGVVLYELLAGKLPFDTQGEKLPDLVKALALAKLRGAVPLRDVQPAVPRPLAELVDACLAVELERRPQSASQLVEALRRCGLRRRFRRSPPPTSRWLVAAVATCLLAVGTVAYSLAPPLRDATTPSSEAAPASVDEMPLTELLERGRQHLRGQDYLSASHYLHAAEQRQPHWTTKAQLAYCHIQLHNVALAKYLLQEALREVPEDPDLLCNFGRCCFLRNEFKLAADNFDRALAFDPSHISSLHNRALCNLRAGNTLMENDGGIRFIQSAIEISESNSSGYARLYLDAAHVVATAYNKGCIPQDEARELLKRHIQSAVSRGVPRNLVVDQPFQPIIDDDAWFQQTIAAARTDITTLEALESGDMLTVPPLN
jgi:eukaryotic-like serine/threonine-protein kinase